MTILTMIDKMCHDLKLIGVVSKAFGVVLMPRRISTSDCEQGESLSNEHRIHGPVLES